MSTEGEDAVEAYVAKFPPEVEARLRLLRAVIVDRFPGAEQKIRYGMPSVMLGGRYGLHFAGWKKHIAIYPVPPLGEPLESVAAPYRSGKDAMSFPHTQEVPYELVGRICDRLAR